MASPYQSLSYPQPLSVAASGSGSCATPPCCIEPACCSRVGSCPCFCTTSTAAFSLSLIGLWCAFVLLLLANSLHDVFNYGEYPMLNSLRGLTLQLGMWQACGYGIGGRWSVSSCKQYGSDVGLYAAWFNNGPMFNAMRVLTLISALATLAAAVLSAVRLAAQQRAKPLSSTLNWSLIAVAVLAFGTATTAFALSMALFNAFPTYHNSWNGTTYPYRGGAWATLTSGWGVLTLAVPLHLIAHFHYQRTVARQSAEQPGLEASLYSAAATPSVFSHPQPQYVSRVAYPTAATTDTAPPTHSVMHSHGYSTAAPPVYMYAR